MSNYVSHSDIRHGQRQGLVKISIDFCENECCHLVMEGSQQVLVLLDTLYCIPSV